MILDCRLNRGALLKAGEVGHQGIVDNPAGRRAIPEIADDERQNIRPQPPAAHRVVAARRLLLRRRGISHRGPMSRIAVVAAPRIRHRSAPNAT